MTTIEEHAATVRSCIVQIEEQNQHIASLKRAQKGLEREARSTADGKNATEREDSVAHRLERSPAYQRLLADIESREMRKAELEGDLEYHKIMARATIASITQAA